MLPISFKVIWAGILNAWDVRDRRVGYVIGTGASTSMAPSATGAGSLGVTIAAGNYSKNGADASTVYAGGAITLTAANGTNPRVDIVYMDSTGTLSKTDGTAAAIVAGTSGPVPPVWPTGCCPLAICFVPAGATDFTTGGYVLDARPFGVVVGGTPALTLGTANTAGVATTSIRTDDTILAFDATPPTVVGYSAVVGVASTAARRDHQHNALSMTNSSNFLTSNVSMTNANTFYDGPTLTIAAGTWLLVGSVDLTDGSADSQMTAKLWDGSTVYAQGVTMHHTASTDFSVALAAVVSPVGSTTYKISAASVNATGLILATVQQNGTANKASYLYAVRLF